MKFISWNVNGLRAVFTKGFPDIIKELDADFVCLQETKMQAGQLDADLPSYISYWNYAVKKGYSGTAIYTRHEPLSVSYGIGIEEHDQEGRVITLEYPESRSGNGENRCAIRIDRYLWQGDYSCKIRPYR